MTEKSSTPNEAQDEATEQNARAPRLHVDRREFLVGTATGVAAVAGVIACDAKAEPGATPVTPEAAAPIGAAPEAPSDQAPPADTKSPDQPSDSPKTPERNVGKGHIVQVTHSGATTDIKKTNTEIVELMVKEAMVKFTGEKDLAAALGKFFKVDDVVGIKVNTLGSPYASVHPATAFAFAKGLHALGIPKKNITIYDQYGSRMRKAGFKTLGEGAKDPTDDFPVHFHETMNYEADKVETGGFFKHKKKDGYPKGTSAFPKLLGKLTAVLNLCCVKDHDLTGVTGALKNVSFGNIDRVPVYHCLPDCNPTCVHDGACNVARIYTHPQMGGKVRLVACDALRVLFQGGPQDNMTFKAAHNSLLVSTDPVAIDRAILEIVNGYRKERGLKSIEEDKGGRRAPRFIQAGEKLGLGVADLSKVKWEKFELG